MSGYSATYVSYKCDIVLLMMWSMGRRHIHVHMCILHAYNVHFCYDKMRVCLGVQIAVEYIIINKVLYCLITHEKFLHPMLHLDYNSIRMFV